MIDILPVNRTEEHLIPALLTPRHIALWIWISRVLRRVIKRTNRCNLRARRDELGFLVGVAELPRVVVLRDVNQLFLRAVWIVSIETHVFTAEMHMR